MNMDCELPACGFQAISKGMGSNVCFLLCTEQVAATFVGITLLWCQPHSVHIPALSRSLLCACQALSAFIADRTGLALMFTSDPLSGTLSETGRLWVSLDKLTLHPFFTPIIPAWNAVMCFPYFPPFSFISH